jgi:hypothetical protein
MTEQEAREFVKSVTGKKLKLVSKFDKMDNFVFIPDGKLIEGRPIPSMNLMYGLSNYLDSGDMHMNDYWHIREGFNEDEDGEKWVLVEEAIKEDVPELTREEVKQFVQSVKGIPLIRKGGDPAYIFIPNGKIIAGNYMDGITIEENREVRDYWNVRNGFQPDKDGIYWEAIPYATSINEVKESIKDNSVDVFEDLTRDHLYKPEFSSIKESDIEKDPVIIFQECRYDPSIIIRNTYEKQEMSNYSMIDGLQKLVDLAELNEVYRQDPLYQEFTNKQNKVKAAIQFVKMVTDQDVTEFQLKSKIERICIEFATGKHQKYQVQVIKLANIYEELV